MDKNKFKINVFFDSLQVNFESKKNIRIIIFLLAVLIFSFIYIQAPLYRSNQHTKFLHGLAKAGYGFLKNDWLAQTIDPLPVFSFLVFFTVKFLHKYVFYFYFTIILGVYVFSLLKISSAAFEYNNSLLLNMIFFMTIAILHSTIIFDSLSYKLIHYRVIEFFFEEGVASQYMIGRAFQPCVFGVFIILSIFLFLKDRYYLSVFFLALASTFHSAYLFSSGILTLTYMIIIYKEEKKMFKPFLIGLISLLLILPVTIYHLAALKATASELSKVALGILVKKRIPHHADPRVWLNAIAFLKIILIGIALFIIRKKRLFLIGFIPFVTTIIFTFIQFLIDMDFIGLLAPWRVSVWLVPISSCIILSCLLSFIYNKFKSLINKMQNQIITICLIISFMFFLSGLVVVIKNYNLYLNKDHGNMMNFVSKNKTENDIYLIPNKIQEFRINTGVPVLVTYKSHPYKDVELLEWYKRLRLSKDFYKKNNDDKCSQLKKLKYDYKITHVVLTEKYFNIKYDCLKEIYRDEEYGVYKLIY